MHAPILDSFSITGSVLLDDCVIEPRGLTVFSGETGAGKSVLLHSLLSVLTGSKPPAGNKNARYGAAFTIDAQWLVAQTKEYQEDIASVWDIDTSFECARVFTGKKWLSFIGEHQLPLSAYSNLVVPLCEHLSQHSSQRLLSPPAQNALFDTLEDGNGVMIHRTYSEARKEVRAAAKELANLKDQRTRAAERIIVLQHYTTELSALEPDKEDASRLFSSAQDRHGNGKVRQKIEQALLTIQDENHGWASTLSSWHGMVDDEIHIRLESVFQEYQQALQTRCESLPSVEDIDRDSERFSLYSELSRKHNCQPEELQTVLQVFQAEYDEIQSLPLLIQQSTHRLSQCSFALSEQAALLATWRTATAKKVDERVTDALTLLGMPGSAFQCTLSPLTQNGKPVYSEWGTHSLAFHWCPHPGAEWIPIQSGASGGETSRVMLALQATRPSTSLLVLDEPDSGIGGMTAHGVAEWIVALSKKRQTLLISHLPQLAKRADAHVYLCKQSNEHSTWTSVSTLSSDQRIAELARMSGLSREEGERIYS